MPIIGTCQKFKLRLRPFAQPELYQPAYSIVLALSIAVLWQAGHEPKSQQDYQCHNGDHRQENWQEDAAAARHREKVTTQNMLTRTRSTAQTQNQAPQDPHLTVVGTHGAGGRSPFQYPSRHHMSSPANSQGKPPPHTGDTRASHPSLTSRWQKSSQRVVAQVNGFS
ncbi:hypothetical protein B0H19DRAFT_1256373 [Mycena capillaripes]|nr:hypothetical protein B0H19DRAFT_1256373 [Mycena capillaripes]